MGFILSALLSFVSPAQAEQTKVISNPYTGRFDYITVLSSETLPSGSTQYIQNTQSLQSGSVFFVSSGTIMGPFRSGNNNNYVNISNAGMITYGGTAGPFIATDKYISRSVDFPLAGEILSSTYAAFAFTDITGAVTYAISLINEDSFSLYNMAIGTTQSNGNMLNVLGNAVITNTLSVGTTVTNLAPVLFKSTSNNNTDMAFAFQRGNGNNILWGTNNGFIYASTFPVSQVATIRLMVAGGMRVSTSVADGNDYLQINQSGILSFAGASHYSAAGNRPVVCTAASPFGMCLWNSANNTWRLSGTGGINSSIWDMSTTGQMDWGNATTGARSTSTATGILQLPNTILLGGGAEQSITVAGREISAGSGGAGRTLTISAGQGLAVGVPSADGGSVVLRAAPGTGASPNGGNFTIDAGSGTNGGAIQIGGVFPTTTTIGRGVNIATFNFAGQLNLPSSLKFGRQGISFSSAPIMHVSGYIASLAPGTTAFIFTPDAPITLRRISIIVTGGGTGPGTDTVRCNDSSNNGIETSVASGAANGTKSTTTGSANIAYQTEVDCHIESTGAVQPNLGVTLEYINQ